PPPTRRWAGPGRSSNRPCRTCGTCSARMCPAAWTSSGWRSDTTRTCPGGVIVSPASESPGQRGGRTDLAVDKVDVAEISSRLAGLGQDFNNRVYPLLDQIRGLEASQPWGATDKVGREFLSHVYNSPLADGTPFSQALRTALDKAGAGLADLGHRGRAAMEQYQQADHLPYRPARNAPT